MRGLLGDEARSTALGWYVGLAFETVVLGVLFVAVIVAAGINS